MLSAQCVPLNEQLRVAASKGQTSQVLQLIEDGAKFDVDREGQSALHVAAQFGHADTSAALLLAACDPNIQDFSGHTALQRAAAEGYAEIIKQLLKYGARVDHQDEVHGNTALHEAAWKGYSQTLESLCKAKANAYIKNKGGFAALHLACQNGHNQSCRVLLLNGCKPDLKNNYGDTPLHTAARYGHAGVMRILISALCNVSEQNKNGDTALHISAAMGRRKLTRILLEAKCDSSIANKQGETAFDIAKRKEFGEVQEILTKGYSKVDGKSQKKREKDSGTSSKDSGSRHKDKQKKTKHGHKLPFLKDLKIGKWSPYGCHFSPNLNSFPSPNLDSLPQEPLKKGEQYYLDLSGNIRKGPVGVGYACYCAPFFQHVEQKLEKDKLELIEHINLARTDLQERMANLERRTRGRIVNLTQIVQEKLAAEQAECHERTERRALRDRLELERQQEMCSDYIRTELKSWVQAKITEFERKHYCNHNPSDIRNYKLCAARDFKPLTRSKSEELLSEYNEYCDFTSKISKSEYCFGDNDKDNANSKIDSELSTLEAGTRVDYYNPQRQDLEKYRFDQNAEQYNDEDACLFLRPREYLETNVDGTHDSKDSGNSTWLFNSRLDGEGNCSPKLNDIDNASNKLASPEPEFLISRQFFDTVTNQMEKWYERRLVGIEKKSESQAHDHREAIEGRIQAIEEQLTKINESFSLSGGSHSGSSLV